MRFVCAVSRVRMAPRRRREEYAGSTRSAFMPAPLARGDSYRKRYRAIVRGFFWESPPVRAEEGAGSACPAGQPGRLNLHLCAAPCAAGGSYRKQYRSIVRGFFWEVTRRRREEGAGSACRASPRLCALAACAACGGFYEKRCVLCVPYPA